MFRTRSAVFRELIAGSSWRDCWMLTVHRTSVSPHARSREGALQQRRMGGALWWTCHGHCKHQLRAATATCTTHTRWGCQHSMVHGSRVHEVPTLARGVFMIVGKSHYPSGLQALVSCTHPHGTPSKPSGSLNKTQKLEGHLRGRSSELCMRVCVYVSVRACAHSGLKGCGDIWSKYIIHMIRLSKNKHFKRANI